MRSSSSSIQLTVHRCGCSHGTQVALQDNTAGGVPLRFKLDVGPLARNEQAFL
jgi:hypothetical protein